MQLIKKDVCVSHDVQYYTSKKHSQFIFKIILFLSLLLAFNDLIFAHGGHGHGGAASNTAPKKVSDYTWQANAEVYAQNVDNIEVSQGFLEAFWDPTGAESIDTHFTLTTKDADGKPTRLLLDFIEDLKMNLWVLENIKVEIKAIPTGKTKRLLTTMQVLPVVSVYAIKALEKPIYTDQLPNTDEHVDGDALLAKQAQGYPKDKQKLPQSNVHKRPEYATSGLWSDVIEWPLVPVSAATLPDGRIISWSSNQKNDFPSGVEFTHTAIWDPKTGQFKEIGHQGHDMFCAHNVMLEDGRLLVAGGNNSGDSPWTSIFDYRNDTWTQIGNMNRGRWYPTAVYMPENKVLISLGRGGGLHPELWDEDNGWMLLTGISFDMVKNYPYPERITPDWWPQMVLAPNEDVYYIGSVPQMFRINTEGLGSMTTVDAKIEGWDSVNQEGTNVIFDEGKVLAFGGRWEMRKSNIIDLNGDTPKVTPTSQMKRPRSFANGVVLPDGEVLAVGGNVTGIYFSDRGSILTPEMWSPKTGQWRDMADITIPRNYHSIALLMTDGRVLSAGGGLCACEADHWDAQVFSPPYLFNPDGTPAKRPVISAAPKVISHGRNFAVRATAGLTKFSMIRMSATTHSTNTDLRYITPVFVENKPGIYTMKAHENTSVLLPGYWMLFGLNNQDVPSVARVIQVVEGDLKLRDPGQQISVAGESVQLKINLKNPNIPGVRFSAVGLPAGLKIAAASGVISGKPTRPSEQIVTVSVADGAGNKASVSFNWSVLPVGSTTPKRYFRFIADAGQNGYAWTSMAELDVLGADGKPLDQSQWKILFVDSEELTDSYNPVIHAIDNDPTTMWHTEWNTDATPANNPPVPHGFVLDLGKPEMVTGFRYLPRQDKFWQGTVTKYRVHVSTDRKDWTLVSQGQFAADKTLKTVTFQQPPKHPPVVTELKHPPQTQGEEISFNLEQSPSGVAPFTYQWQFGDGSTLTAPSATTAVKHRYTKPGRYAVSSVVTDSQGKKKLPSSG